MLARRLVRPRHSQDECGPHRRCRSLMRPARPRFDSRYHDQDTLTSKSPTSSEVETFRCQDVFLHHVSSSKHSLSLRTRLTERRVLACNRLILACFRFADLRTAHPFLAPFDRPKRPFGPLFLRILRTTANPSEGRESSIYAGFLGLDFLGVRFGHADRRKFRSSVRWVSASRPAVDRPPW